MMMLMYLSFGRMRTGCPPRGPHWIGFIISLSRFTMIKRLKLAGSETQLIGTLNNLFVGIRLMLSKPHKIHIKYQNVSLLIYSRGKKNNCLGKQILRFWLAHSLSHRHCHMGIHIIIRRLLSEHVGRTSGTVFGMCNGVRLLLRSQRPVTSSGSWGNNNSTLFIGC